MSVINSITASAKRSPGRTAIYSLGLVVVVAAAAFVAVLLMRDDSSANAQSGGTQLEFQVQRGDITTSLSVGGTSTFPVSAELSFESAGTLDSTMVESGDTVQEGDVIAQLDPSTVAALKVAVTTAESALNDAQAAYDKAASGATGRAAIADAEEQVALAELAVKAAESSLLDVQAAAGVDGATVMEAREDIAFAERDLAAAQDDLNSAIDAAELQDLQDALADAESAYRDELLNWLGAAPEGFETQTLDDILDSWNVTLTEIYTTYADQHLDSTTPWIDNPETPWNEVIIWTLTSMSRNDVDPESESPIDPTIFTPRVDIAAAWDSVEKAREAYENAVDANATLVLAAEKAVSNAQSNLDAARSALEDLLDPNLLAARQAALDSAEAELDQALITRQQVIDGAAATMAEAESRLELATQELADARSAYESSTLFAPFSGTVLVVNFEEGDAVTPANVIAEIADTSVIAVESSVDEEDILSIEVGLPVSVSLDAVTGQRFSGTVTSIGQAEQSQQGAVSFPVTVTLDDTGDLALVEGLTASAQIISSQVTDVLMVPVAAVGGSILSPTVDVMQSGGTEPVPVQLGSSNGTFVEVLSGVEEGDTVLATIAGDVGLPSTDQLFVPGGNFGGLRQGGATGTTSITLGGGGGGGRGGN